MGSGPSIDTLIEDIYSLLGSDKVDLSPPLLTTLGEDIQSLMSLRLSSGQEPPRLRLSSVGKPARQLYYEINLQGKVPSKETLPGNVRIKFLFGDLWELVLLYLAKEAGHEVTHQQSEVEINGVKGHNDAIIDGVVVDIKSASSYAFKKFENGTLVDDDPFGYMEQLASYCTALGGRDGAFLAVDKQTGKLALLKFPFEYLKKYAVEERIEYLKEELSKDHLPDRCYDTENEGSSGNQKLNVNCSYCPFKFDCWSDSNNGAGLRTFLYSTGPKHFTKIVKEPKVMEITF